MEKEIRYERSYSSQNGTWFGSSFAKLIRLQPSILWYKPPTEKSDYRHSHQDNTGLENIRNIPLSFLSFIALYEVNFAAVTGKKNVDITT